MSQSRRGTDDGSWVPRAVRAALTHVGSLIATNALAFVTWLNLKPLSQMGTRERRRLRAQLFESLGPSVAILFLEIVFKISTTGGLLPSSFFLLLFSLGIGLVCYLLCSLFRSRTVNFAIKEVILLAFGVLFCVEYFVFVEFKVFYDLKTVKIGRAHV